jgi:hypothetical protein
MVVAVVLLETMTLMEGQVVLVVVRATEELLALQLVDKVMLAVLVLVAALVSRLVVVVVVREQSA